MIDGIKIFDAHMHHIGRFKKRDETLIQFLNRYNIDKAVITTLNRQATLDLITSSEVDKEEEMTKKFVMKQQYNHEDVRELVQNHPDRLIGFFWFNPRIATEDDWKLLTKYVKEYRFKGIKTQACVDLLKVPRDLQKLAEVCIEFDVPLFLHASAGFFFQSPYKAKDYYELARQNKELKCIIGHAAHTMEYCINLLYYFEKLPNVYFETSCSIPYGILTLIKAMGSQRVIYGSDAPTAGPPDIEINKIRCLNLDKQTLENIFYNNISNLLKE